MDHQEEKLTRVWCMPNKHTFLLPPVAELLKRIVGEGRGWADPYANANSPAEATNDLNPEMPTDYHMDAVDFLRLFPEGAFNGVLLDPPYSETQVTRTYGGYGPRKPFTMFRDEAARVIKPGGLAVTFGWNSNGLGACRGFRREETHMIAHGGLHNDTLVTVERKIDAPVQLRQREG